MRERTAKPAPRDSATTATRVTGLRIRPLATDGRAFGSLASHPTAREGAMREAARTFGAEDLDVADVEASSSTFSEGAQVRVSR